MSRKRRKEAREVRLAIIPCLTGAIALDWDREDAVVRVYQPNSPGPDMASIPADVFLAAADKMRES